MVERQQNPFASHYIIIAPNVSNLISYLRQLGEEDALDLLNRSAQALGYWPWWLEHAGLLLLKPNAEPGKERVA